MSCVLFTELSSYFPLYSLAIPAVPGKERQIGCVHCDLQEPEMKWHRVFFRTSSNPTHAKAFS